MKRFQAVALSTGLLFEGAVSASIVTVMPLPNNYFYQTGDVFHWTGGPQATGNYYMPVLGAYTYAQALAAAAATPIPVGVPAGYFAHLLTITSTQEATMIDAVFPGGAGSTWIAVSYTNTSNAVYTAGPEIGQPVLSFLTPNWQMGSPAPGDTYAYLNCSTNEWAGADSQFVEGYVVEFSAIPGPSAAAMMLPALALLRRRR